MIVIVTVIQAILGMEEIKQGEVLGWGLKRQATTEEFSTVLHTHKKKKKKVSGALTFRYIEPKKSKIILFEFVEILVCVMCSENRYSHVCCES